MSFVKLEKLLFNWFAMSHRDKDSVWPGREHEMLAMDVFGDQKLMVDVLCLNETRVAESE